MRKLLILLLLIPWTLFSNENIDKLNSLLQNNIIEEASYIKSLSEIGIDIKSNDFKKLFELFKDKIINEKDYSVALNKFLKPNEMLNNKITQVSDAYKKKYILDSCTGNNTVCKEVMESLGQLVENNSNEEEYLFIIDYNNNDSCREIFDLKDLWKKELADDKNWTFLSQIFFDHDNEFSYLSKFNVNLPGLAQILIDVVLKGTKSNNCENFDIKSLDINGHKRNLATFKLIEYDL